MTIEEITKAHVEAMGRLQPHIDVSVKAIIDELRNMGNYIQQFSPRSAAIVENRANELEKLIS